ncbi:glucose/arabinose dehydrogenase [Rhizobium alvei]
MPMPFRPRAGLFTLLLLAQSVSVEANESYQTRDVSITVETLASGLDYPWSVMPVARLGYIITERSGHVRILSNGTLSAPLPGLPKLYVHGQGGLLDVALSPNFEKDRLLYFTATQAQKKGVGVILFSARLADDLNTLEETTILFRFSAPNPADYNFGSRIAFSPDGYLFVTIGDHGVPPAAQDLMDDRGAVIRLNRDGSVPTNNPYYSNLAALPELWSIGHRNPQGIAFDAQDGKLWTVEHGPKGGDEINTPEPGKNYGWPVVTYGVNYDDTPVGIGTSADGFEQPKHYWVPSITPSALVVYRGAMFPEWNGDLLVSALKGSLISRLIRSPAGDIIGEERFLEDDYGRLRDIHEDLDGSLLVLTDDDDGKLLRISR